MGIPSLKKRIITNFSVATTMEELIKNEIILITALGIISGKLADVKNTDDEKELPEKILPRMANVFYERYIEENNLESPLDGNDGYLALINVTITNGDVVHRLNELVVFYDQIIGITIGKLHKD